MWKYRQAAHTEDEFTHLFLGKRRIYKLPLKLRYSSCSDTMKWITGTEHKHRNIIPDDAFKKWPESSSISKHSAFIE